MPGENFVRGRLFTASGGAQTTPLTARAYDQDQPEFCIRIPAGTGIWDYKIDINLESYAGTDNEVIVWSTTNDVGDGTSTVADGTPTATNAIQSVSSNCTARQLYTANVTLTNYRELARSVQPLANTMPNRIVLPDPNDTWWYIPGAATLGVQIAATSTQPTFYINVYWSETFIAT